MSVVNKCCYSLSFQPLDFVRGKLELESIKWIQNLVQEDKNLIAGQILLELLVALVLIILFLSGITIIELYAIKNVSFAENKSQATRLARQQLERARVVRDSAGIDALYICQATCFINISLTPEQLMPTGTFVQSLVLRETTASDCPLPDITITPVPVSYKATSTVSWLQGGVASSEKVELSTCITDWR